MGTGWTLVGNIFAIAVGVVLIIIGTISVMKISGDASRQEEQELRNKGKQESSSCDRMNGQPQ